MQREIEMAIIISAHALIVLIRTGFSFLRQIAKTTDGNISISISLDGAGKLDYANIEHFGVNKVDVAQSAGAGRIQSH